jgi:hypothetical protein
MKNKDIYTFERHLFIKRNPLRNPLRIRTGIRMNHLIDVGSMVGLLALVVMALAW